MPGNTVEDIDRDFCDAKLLSRMGAGDARAAAIFVRRYQARVFGLALALVGVAATAEEVAQEVFLRAWARAGDYDPRRGEVATWLLTIARNTAIDAMRLRRDSPCSPVMMASLMAERETNPVDVTDIERVRAALRELPRHQAAAVVMARCYGLTAREIAAHEGCPVGTAKTRIRLGTARLRDLLVTVED